jgi:pyridoxal phosphate enzyme (YggS family)
MMGMADRIAAVEERVDRACARAGRKRDEVRLMGVTKFQPRDSIVEAWNAGLRLFGESRVQEASAKFEGFREQYPGTELHLIGTLQRNKAKSAALLFDGIQSLDRDELIDELGKHTVSRNASLGTPPLGALLELNAGEASKSGYRDADSLYRGAEKLLAAPALIPRGLMIIAPLSHGDAAGTAARTAFRALARAQQELYRRFPEADWSCLSMGMSGDYETAIEEGSTLVRIGTAIFGERLP